MHRLWESRIPTPKFAYWASALLKQGLVGALCPQPRRSGSITRIQVLCGVLLPIYAQIASWRSLSTRLDSHWFWVLTLSFVWRAQSSGERPGPPVFSFLAVVQLVVSFRTGSSTTRRSSLPPLRFRIFKQWLPLYKDRLFAWPLTRLKFWIEAFTDAVYSVTQNSYFAKIIHWPDWKLGETFHYFYK